MTAVLLLLVFALFAGLMFSRRLPAILALPGMAILTALLVKTPFVQILNEIVGGGAAKLAPVYVAVFAGAMMGRVMMQTGIAEEIIKRAAEFGGERPLVVACFLMCVTAVLFTTLQGLGAIITVGSLVLPIMMSLGLPRRLAASLFLLAFGTGFIFNPILLTLYRTLLKIEAAAPMPREFSRFAFGLLGIMLLGVTCHAIVAARRTGEIYFWAVKSKDELLERRNAKRVPALALLTPLVPLGLYFGFNYKGLKLDFVPAFILGSLFAVFLVNPGQAVKTLSASVVRGLEDGAPAAILMMGIGMLLNALSLPGVRLALEPWIQALPLASPLFYILFFGILSPLALYRGPLNLFGVGIGIYSIMFAAGVLPPLALLAAIMSVVQVQNICDPTNTHNVWIANFAGVRVEELTKSTLLTMVLVCFGGLLLGAWMFLK